MLKDTFMLLLVFYFISCSNLKEYYYQPKKDVRIKVILNKYTHSSESGNKWDALYFDYKISNSSNTQIYFRFDSIKVQFNGNISSKIYFNSIATVLPTIQKIKGEEKEFQLYAVFPDSIVLNTKNDFQILNYGFVQ